MPSKNNRRYPRLFLQLRAHGCSVDSPQATFPIQVINIGAEGVCFTCQNVFPPGHKIQLNIFLPSNVTIEMTIQIVWQEAIPISGHYRAGAKIIDMPARAMDQWMSFYCQKVLHIPNAEKKILVVEDEHDAAQLLTLELETAGYTVVVASDGEEGFAKYESDRPSLIILDVMLPKLNGYEVCRRIRRQKGDECTPIIMLTAKKEDVDRIQGRVIGATVYLSKPFEAEHLLGLIQKFLE